MIHLEEKCPVSCLNPRLQKTKSSEKYWKQTADFHAHYTDVAFR